MKTYLFDVPAALLADGSAAILLNINVPVVNDGYSIDYSELRIATESVPEPGSLSLFLAGMFAAAVAVRRRRRP